MTTRGSRTGSWPPSRSRCASTRCSTSTAHLERRQTPTDARRGGGRRLLILLLEACRRTTGWVLPVVSLVFIAYAYYGGYLPYTWSLAHQGFNFDAIIAQFTMGTAGFYGMPLECGGHLHRAVHDLRRGARLLRRRQVLHRPLLRRVQAQPYGARPHGHAGRLPARHASPARVRRPPSRSAPCPGRSCAGPATRAEPAGGMLAAAGIGAILSPPTLGAAAFIIAEYLQVSYLTVLGVRRHPDDPVLPGHPARDRDRRPPARDHVGGDLRGFGVPVAGAVRVPLPLAVRDHRLHGGRRTAVQGRRLRGDHRSSRCRSWTASTGSTAGRLFKALAQGTRSVSAGGGDLRGRRHDRRGHHPDRARAEPGRAHRRRGARTDRQPHRRTDPDRGAVGVRRR